jgi:3-oxoacyl-[acyl-carrier protein] reductase
VNAPPLAGRVAVVTGATGHLGGAVAHGLAEMGASVVVHYRRQADRARVIVASLPGDGRHVALAADLAAAGEARTLFEQAREALAAAPTVLVDAAYPAQPPVRAADLTDEYVERHLAGLRAHVNACRAALPGMRAAGWGRIVMLTGALAWRPFPGFAMYGAVKAAAAAFARTLSLEEGRAGITVNALALGRIEYADGAGAFLPDPAYEELDEVTRRRVALPEMASPEDVAASVRYLVSPAAGAVTGQVIFLAAGEPI